MAGKTTAPLTFVVDPDLALLEAFQALKDQGHTVIPMNFLPMDFELASADLILGTTACRFDARMLKLNLLDRLIKLARAHRRARLSQEGDE